MFGLDWNNPQTLWLNITNAVLGIATAVALLAILGGVVAEAYAWLKGRIAATADAHSLHVHDLGMTMADGGEEIDETKRETPGS